MAFKIRKPPPSDFRKPRRTARTVYRGRGNYRSLAINGFRSFADLHLEELGSINLICGRNNSGKTSLLEAVYAHASGYHFGPFHSQVVLRRSDNSLSGALDAGEKILSVFRNTDSFPCSFSISAQLMDDRLTHTLTSRFFPSAVLADLDPRGMGQYSRIAPSGEEMVEQSDVFPNDKALSKVGIKVRPTFVGKWQMQFTGDKVREVSLQYPPTQGPAFEPFKLAVWSDVLTHRDPTTDIRVFSHLKRYDALETFTEEMQKVYPEIRRIDLIPYPDSTQGPISIYTKDNKIIPLHAFGDGMRRWFYLLGHMIVYKSAVHCIEEIDSTFHSTAHYELSRLLVSYAQKYSNQLFMTSHSMEFIDTFLKALYAEDGILQGSAMDPVRVFTIRRSSEDGGHEVWPLTGKEAFEKRSQFDLELR